jgi:tetratricopeptide (TPR) repeat protein
MDEGKRELERYRQMRAEAEIERRREFEVTALLRAVTQSMGRGDYEDAAARLRDAIGLKPGDPALHVSLGLVLGNAGRLPDAIEAFERALKLGADLEVHRHLFNAYTALGRPGDAQRHRELYEKPRTEGPSR